jgi:diguanylate cyclase (GGDEF)-like protein
MDRAKAEGGRGWRAFGPDVAACAQRRDDLAAEVEALRAANVRLFDESRRDAGTGLPNLRRLQEDLPAAEAAAVASHGSYAVVFIDLDHFGALNKHRGDHAGDDALRRVAGLLAGGLRSGDTVYRKGGEEFVALLPGAGLEVGLRVAERLRAAVESAGIAHGGVPGFPVVTASVGVAAGPASGLDVHGVLREAGGAMLLAKQSGRNRVSAARCAVTYGG